MSDVQLLKFAVHQLVLVGHLGLFAVAIATVIREDFRLLTSKALDNSALLDAADKLRSLLIGLWVTGVALVLMNTGWNVLSILDNPKVMAKILVVLALTVNGIALHNVAFALLRNPSRSIERSAAICAVLGGISTATWIFASFVGSARIIAPFMSLQGFMLLYAAALLVAIPSALAIAQPRLARMMAGHEPKPEPTVQQQIHTALRSCVGPVYQWLIEDAHKEGADKLIDDPSAYVNALAAQIPPDMLATKGRFFERSAAVLDRQCEPHA
nr:hypothetical protein [uncultured Aquabacterium sp.]